MYVTELQYVGVACVKMSLDGISGFTSAIMLSTCFTQTLQEQTCNEESQSTQVVTRVHDEHLDPKLKTQTS